MAYVDVVTLLQDFIPLSFYSEPDGPIVGSGTFKSTILVPGYFILKCLLFFLLLYHFVTTYLYIFREPEAFYVGPPSREQLPKVYILLIYILVRYKYYPPKACS